MSDNKEKMIRFIDSEYNTLFFIPDGGNIVINRYDDEKVTAVCTFLDEYHTQIGKEAGRGEIYHICQWAEICERNGNTYAPEKPPELPDKCFSVIDGEMVIIERGKKGYTPIPGNYPEQNRRDADRKNSYLGVTRQQEAAMRGGATRGWITPAARVSAYDFKGEPVTPTKSKTPKKNRAAER